MQERRKLAACGLWPLKYPSNVGAWELATLACVLGWAGLGWDWMSCRQQSKSTWTIKEWSISLCKLNSMFSRSALSIVIERLSSHPYRGNSSFLFRNFLDLHSILAALCTCVSKLLLLFECLVSFLLWNCSSPSPCGSGRLLIRASTFLCSLNFCLVLALDVQLPLWIFVNSVSPQYLPFFL